MNNEFNNENNYYEGNNNHTSNSADEIIEAKVVSADKPKRKHKTIKAFTRVVAFGLVFGLAAGAALQGVNYITVGSLNDANVIGKSINETKVNTSESNNSPITEEVGKPSSSAAASLTSTSGGNVTSDVSTVVENVMPSIVSINSVMTNTATDFFGREFSEDAQASGSGIIIGQNKNEILIATNNHVVQGAKSVSITFADESKASATIKGTAPNSDLAVVSVKTSDLKNDTISKIKIATLGNSNTTKLGEMAIAIGNALGYGQSVTVGYISALNREVTVENNTMKLIQTDAAINPGNSGGALLNSKGEVIGINSVKYVDSSVESIGYAIPISDAIPIINELMNRTELDKSESAYLGISGKDVTDVYAQNFGMPIGIYVGDVAKGSAAEKAGIQKGDIIVSINNIKVKTMADLQNVLSYTKAKSTGTVSVKVLENGNYIDKSYNVTFGTKPNEN